MRLNWLGLSLIVSVFVTTHGFLQFELVRIPHRTKKFNPIKSDCPDATKLNK